MRTQRSRALVVELLRTLDDALNDTNGSGSSSDGGVIQMPVLYHHGSYQELERCLRTMRDDYRTQWWHLSMRYRWGDPHRRLLVPSRKTRQGRIPLLPPRTELRIQGETLAKGLMLVYCYCWDDRVSQRMVDRGVETLTGLMYGGQWWRLTLPKPFLERLEAVA